MPNGQNRRDELRQKLRLRHESVEAVRRQSGGKHRDELRVLLKTELARRGASEPPSGIEILLDKIQAAKTPFGLAAFYAGGLTQLMGVPIALLKGLRQAESSEIPEWLEPPTRASYHVRADSRYLVAVDLDPAKETWLDQVLNGSPIGTKSMSSVRTWLSWDPEPPTQDSRLAVHIGAERVGVISEADVAVFSSEMAAATRKDALPWTMALLHRRDSPPTHLLELFAPRSD